MSDAEDNDDSSKTEDPSPRKLEESRKKGQVAVSREVNTWLILVAGTVVIGATLSGMFSEMAGYMEHMIGDSYQIPQGPGGVSKALGDATSKVIGLMLGPLAILAAAAFFGPFLQAGPLFAPEMLKPDLQKISPLKGMKRLFSLRSILEFIKGLVKISVVTVVTYFILKPYLPGAEHFVGMAFPQLLDELLSMTMRLLMAVVMVMLIFAGLDLAYQRYDHYQRLRMTKQELKDEYRQTEGDPVMRGRLRQLRYERARQRMMQNVPKADVVITNPTHFAVALQYDPDEMPAPKVVAKGADAIAKKIREVAMENGVEIYENPPLARALYSTVEVDQIIPQELYRAVAEVITYVFKKTGKLKPRR